MTMTFLNFHNGHRMPKVGLGTWLVKDRAESDLGIEKALEIGYRHFDTATKYENEAVVGRAFKKWLESPKNLRQDLFVVTKLPWIGMRGSRVEEFCRLSLQKLEVDYIDLYLVHWPFGLKYKGPHVISPTSPDGQLDFDLQSDLEGVWKAMELQVDAGRVKSIGLSNCNVGQIERILKIARIPPANLQVEVHAYFQQKELRDLCRRNGITVVAYGPLGSPGRRDLQTKTEIMEIPALLEDPLVKELGNKYGRTAGQILLRFLTQLEIAVIPKSINPDRMNENFHIFDFEIGEEDMKRLELLDKGEAGRSFQGFPGAKASHPEFPF